MRRVQGDTEAVPQRTQSPRGSNVTAERGALLILSFVLAGATIVIYRLYSDNMETKTKLQTLKDNIEAMKKSGELCMKCERGWDLHGGMCYYFSNTEASWQDSKSKCQYLGGALVKIDGRQEQAFLDEKVTSKMNYVADQYWIGLTDLEEEGKWLWVDGSPLDPRLSFWQLRQPDNWKVENPDGENCARMGLRDGSCKLKSWFDKSCKANLKSICEKPATVSAQLQL